MRSEKGFTYVELLIVALIVLLLVTICWEKYLQGPSKEELLGVATESDAVAAVLARMDAQVESTVLLSDQARIEQCTDFFNAAFRVRVSQPIEGQQDVVTTTDVSICCRGLGKQRYCQYEEQHVVPPSEISD